VLVDLEPGAIGALRASPLGGRFRPGNLVTQNTGASINLATNSLNHPDVQRPL
jgi:hypothetical protein